MANNRRSTPELEVSQRSMHDLYPSSLDSDPKELAQQLTDVLTQHARAHERHVRHAMAFNERVQRMEETMGETKTQIDGLDDGIIRLEKTVTSGFADVKLERAIEQTKFRTTFAVLAVVWSILSVVGGAAWHYLTKPSCKEGEALLGDSCVPVTVVRK